MDNDPDTKTVHEKIKILLEPKDLVFVERQEVPLVGYDVDLYQAITSDDKVADALGIKGSIAAHIEAGTSSFVVVQTEHPDGSPLTILVGSNETERIELPAGEEVTLGRQDPHVFEMPAKQLTLRVSEDGQVLRIHNHSESNPTRLTAVTRPQKAYAHVGAMGVSYEDHQSL